MEFNGIHDIEVDDISWNSMENIMEFHGILWNSMEFHEFMEFYEIRFRQGSATLRDGEIKDVIEYLSRLTTCYVVSRVVNYILKNK
jgi:hypothetical protein